ncbi:MAG: hypothetical protein GC151_12925 [Betaproteobacteria bacterium]|nr:hypothetical protein [Betaproteobacteria bacterium]
MTESGQISSCDRRVFGTNPFCRGSFLGGPLVPGGSSTGRWLSSGSSRGGRSVSGGGSSGGGAGPGCSPQEPGSEDCPRIARLAPGWYTERADIFARHSWTTNGPSTAAMLGISMCGYPESPCVPELPSESPKSTRRQA